MASTISYKNAASVSQTLRAYLRGDDRVKAVTVDPASEGGLLAYRNLDLGTTGQVVKASAGQLYGWYLANASTSTRYVKIYDKATAATTSDTPVLTIALPGSAAANCVFPMGIEFDNGISARATTGIADANSDAPSTNDVLVNLMYF